MAPFAGMDKGNAYRGSNRDCPSDRCDLARYNNSPVFSCNIFSSPFAYSFNMSGRYTKISVGVTRTVSVRMGVAPFIALSVTVYSV